MQRIAWSKIPILNHLRHHYPDRNPIVVYEKIFGERLLEPGGGQYVWDEQRATYVSTSQGYHLEPIVGPSVAPAFGPRDTVKTTLSFQDNGLRATLRFEDKE